MYLFNSIIPAFGRATASAEASGAASATPVIKPTYDVQETSASYQLVVQLPGVSREGLELTVENEGLRLVGRRTWIQPTGWTALHRETTDASYELVLEHDNAIDADQATAELRDGVLHVTLPKHETIKPRKIAVT